MNATTPGATSRRTFLKTTGGVAVSALAVPRVHAGEDHTIRLVLIGCGGRGTGAAANALSVRNGPLKLVAMADVFAHRLDASHRNLAQKFAATVDVPEERKFIGFDAYKKAMDCIGPGDVAIFTTPPAFRWVHFTYAIQKGLNVFMEKPVTVDGPSTRRMLQLAAKSVEKNLKVGVGLMCRHCAVRRELHERISAGQIGELLMMRTYRMTGPVGSAFTDPKPEGISELMYQIQRFHAFLWASGGCYSDFLIHNIDECCWMKGAWPIRAKASGGRHYRGDAIDQNFDVYSVEYTFADGTKLLLDGRNMPGCYNEFASYGHGTKGLAVISSAVPSPAKCRIYKGHNLAKDQLAWAFAPPEPNSYQLEWDDLIDAIRQDKPYNEVKRGAEASLVTSMGRMAAHTGQVITYDQMLDCPHEFAPAVDTLTMDGPAPLQADRDGTYPVPMPGLKKKREY